MKSPLLSVRTLAAVALVIGGLTIAGRAQFTITLPNLPKVKKTKPAPTPEPSATGSDASAAPTSSTASADDESPVSPKEKGCESDSFYQVWNEEIQKTVEDAKSFT